MHAVVTTGLTHQYSAAEPVLHQVALEVQTGTIYGFLGPNGAGKTTTLRLILGLLRPQAGTILVFGRSLMANRIDILRLPPGTIPLGVFFRRDLDYFIDALPIAAIQYLLALRFSNFMVPVGVGMALWIAAIGGLSWQYNYLIPYAYVAIDYTTTIKSQVSHALPASTQMIAACVFAGFTLAAYVLYVTKNDRG